MNQKRRLMNQKASCASNKLPWASAAAVLLAVLALFLANVAQSANYTTQVRQGTGANWNDAIWNPGPVSPTAGNTYECIEGGAPTRIRCPAADGVQTFPGDSLTLNAGTEIRAKKGSGNNTVMNFPGVGGNPGLIMNGGNLDVGDDWICGLAGKILVQADSTMMCGDNSSANRSWRIEGQITGSAGLTISNNPGTVMAMNIVSSNNPYTGTWTIYGGIFKATGVNSLGYGNIIVNPGSNSATLEVMYDLKSPGTLTVAPGNAKLTLHQNLTFSAVTIGGIPLGEGTISYEDLLANFPNNINSGGSGSITVGPIPPVLLTSPVDQTVDAGSTVYFSVTALDPLAINYTWLTNGQVDPRVAESTYSFAPITTDNGMTFQAILANVVGSVTSKVATLTVIAPPAPINLTTVGGLSDIVVGWDSQAGATNYILSRAASLAGPYSDILATTGTSFDDTGLAAGAIFYYRVAAQSPVGQSLYSEPVIGYAIPPVTTGLVAMPGDTQVILNWAATAGALSYNVKKSSTQGGPYTTIANVTTLAYIDTGLANLSQNYYVVSAVNPAGEGPDSSEALGIPNTAPGGVVATGGTNAISLQWAALDGATSYNVKRAMASGGPYTTVGSGLATSSYEDPSLANGTAYYYVISAQLAGGESANSLQVTAVTAPSAPTGLAITATNFSTATLAWTFNDPVAASFTIEQSKDGGAFTVAGAAAESDRTFTASNLDQGRSYTFRVQALNATGYSPYSATATCTVPYFTTHVNFGAGPAGQGGVMPDYPGYLRDIGEAYGLRANGFTYGWDIDNQANARYRNSATSPDLRYDTLNHLQKTTPGRTWEIAVPPGIYLVHIVGGDPNNFDTTAQYDIEGNVTEALPMGADHWKEFTLAATVSDGKLTVTSGPLAVNNKICFIDILAPEPPVIVGQPQALALNEGQSALFTVQCTGAPLYYQWFFNDAEVVGATGPSLNIPYARCTDAGQYKVSVTNAFGAVMSQPASLTVEADTVAPFVVSVGSLDGNTIGVVFSEPVLVTDNVFKSYDNWEIMDTNIAAHMFDDFGNPTYYNYPVTQVIPYPDPSAAYSDKVVLVLGGGGQYIPAVSGVFSVLCNYVLDYSCAANQGAGFAESVPMGLNQVDIWDPLPAGSVFVGSSNKVQVTAGGMDIWNSGDQFTYCYRQVNGDFDAQATVLGIPYPPATPPNVWSKAAIMLRGYIQDTDGVNTGSNIGAATNSYMAYIAVTPTNGQHTFASGIRHVNNTGAIDIPGAIRPYIYEYPAQVRMVRQGDTITTFSWSYLTNADLTLVGPLWVTNGVTATTNWASTMYLGLATTSHSQGNGVQTAYEDFQVLPLDAGPYSLTISKTDAGVVVSWPNTSTWMLQTAPQVGVPSAWTDYTGTKTDDGTQWTVTFPTDSPMKFFRLKK